MGRSYIGVHESSLPVAHPGYQVLSDVLFRLGLIANCSHTVQYLDCQQRLELTLQSLSPVLALYDPFGVDVPLNWDTTTTTTDHISSDRKLCWQCHPAIEPVFEFGTCVQHLLYRRVTCSFKRRFYIFTTSNQKRTTGSDSPFLFFFFF